MARKRVNQGGCSIFIQGVLQQIGRIKEEHSCVQSWQTGPRGGRGEGRVGRQKADAHK